jgi:hypothetical protein
VSSNHTATAWIRQCSSNKEHTVIRLRLPQALPTNNTHRKALGTPHSSSKEGTTNTNSLSVVTLMRNSSMALQAATMAMPVAINKIQAIMLLVSNPTEENIMVSRPDLVHMMVRWVRMGNEA